MHRNGKIPAKERRWLNKVDALKITDKENHFNDMDIIIKHTASETNSSISSFSGCNNDTASNRQNIQKKFQHNDGSDSEKNSQSNGVCKTSSKCDGKSNFSYKQILMMSNECLSPSSTLSSSSTASTDNYLSENQDECEIKQQHENTNAEKKDRLKANGGKKNVHVDSLQSGANLNDIEGDKYHKERSGKISESFDALSAAPRESVFTNGESIDQALSQEVDNQYIERDYQQSLRSKKKQSFLDRSRNKYYLKPYACPIEFHLPSEYELRGTNGLMKYVNNWYPSPDADELAKKYLLMSEISRLLDTWISKEAKKNYQDDIIASASLYCCGSWYLKVATITSDLNMVALVPVWISFERFITNFKLVLEDICEISNLMIINHPSLHGLKFCYNNMTIDLLLSRFSKDAVPNNLPIHSDHVLSDMDLASIRALSGPRVAARILKLVPNPSAFRRCLRAVRFWAERRGIYNSKLGFLNGISLSISVALICQMFPKAVASALLHHYFTFMSTWVWPTPLLIAKPYDADLGYPQWSCIDNIHDRSHVMPIITPGYPGMNTTISVNPATLDIIKEEFERAKYILDNLLISDLTGPRNWKVLFSECEFNYCYTHYLCITLSAKKNHDQELNLVTNSIEVKIRKFVQELYRTDCIVKVHPYSKSIEHHDESRKEKIYFIGFEIYSQYKQGLEVEIENAQVIVNPVINYFTSTELQRINTNPNIHVDISYKIWNELPHALFPLGKKRMAGLRAQYMLTRAHNSNKFQPYYMYVALP